MSKKIRDNLEKIKFVLADYGDYELMVEYDEFKGLFHYLKMEKRYFRPV